MASFSLRWCRGDLDSSFYLHLSEPVSAARCNLGELSNTILSNMMGLVAVMGGTSTNALVLLDDAQAFACSLIGVRLSVLNRAALDELGRGVSWSNWA